MKRALVLVNAKSRKGAEMKAQVTPALEKVGIQVLEASEKDPGNFKEVIERFKDKVDLVIVGGGDGSCLSCVEALQGSKIPLGVLPLGTANNLARNLGIPLTLEGACDVLATGEVRKIDLGKVNGKFFFNVSGMGLSSQVNRTIPAELKRRWGHLGYVIHAAKVARRMSAFSAEITCDGEKIHSHTLQITVCNGRHYGAGMTIAEDAGITDGRLDLTSAEIKHWWEAFLLWRSVKSGRHRPESAIRQISGARIEVRTRRPISVDTDGEVSTRTPCIYEIVPEALLAYAPRQGVPGEQPRT